MQDLTEGKPGRLIFRFATPMLIGNVFQQIYNVTDSIIVGKFLGKEALAAVGASFPLIFLLISFIIGIASGSTIIISHSSLEPRMLKK
jgi:Na+-driven multidrug efflux pump